MTLTQPKIDLAVLHMLFLHAEGGGEPETPATISCFFSVGVSTRRVEIALEELERRGEVERIYHPHYREEGLWRISREGVRTVERAISNETTFIGRLHAKGEEWLLSEEAKNSKLQPNPRYEAQPLTAMIHPTPSSPMPRDPIISPVTAKPSKPESNSTDWSKWGAIAAWIVIPITVVGIIVAIYLDHN